MRAVKHWMVGMMACLTVTGCTGPLDSLKGLNQMALVSIRYDANIYTFHPHMGVNRDNVYAPFSNTPTALANHNELLIDYLKDLKHTMMNRIGIEWVYPRQLVNTSLLSSTPGGIQYEYLLDPYDPIDRANRPFMAGLAQSLNVDAVVGLSVSYAIYVDPTTFWDDYSGPLTPTSPMLGPELRAEHESSLLRTTVDVVIVARDGQVLYEASHAVDTPSDRILVDNQDLNTDGGVALPLLKQGVRDWINDWVPYTVARPTKY